MKIFNTRALTRKQRFSKALLFGSITTIALLIALSLLRIGFAVYSSLLYIVCGFAIGYAIQYFGRGVQIQFSILAVVLTLLCIVVNDLLAFGSISICLQVATSSIFDAGYRIVACYLAYTYARVV